MAVLLSLRMDRIEVVDDEDEHPRNPVNIHNYLVDETFPDYEEVPPPTAAPIAPMMCRRMKTKTMI